jgi:UDP-N-acetylmuramate dehydrogenase
MISRNVSLAPFTTFHIGGPARFFIEAHSERDIEDAIAYAREHKLRVHPLGGGSNLLVPDHGVAGIVLKMSMHDIAYENDGDETLLIADAGAVWEDVIDGATARGLFGVENLAGIPGTIGGASVQNIGAYGAELKEVFAYADVINSATGLPRRLTRAEATFGYRTSFFKEHREYIITRVALRLKKHSIPNVAYPDLLRAQADGVPLTTPEEVARSIRSIRAQKFPHDNQQGTAGSFFKNPVISQELADTLAKRFPDMPMFPNKNGMVKISLAWLLDHALSLKGFSVGRARLYEGHALVIVAHEGACAAEVDALAQEVTERMFALTGITIEREVETFGA